MNTKDLMIGDWVRCRWICSDTGREVVRDFQVAEIRKNGETVYVWSEGGNVGAVEKIEPIPLTPEILEKNGFEIRGKRKYFLVPNDPSLAIKREPCIGSNGNSFLIGHFWERNKEFRWFVEINYVHELQHALRLCGIDKEIEL